MLRTAAVAALLGVSAADIHFSRTVEKAPSWASGKVTIAGGACAGSDAYGSSDCHFQGGKTYSVDVDGTLSKAVPGGSVAWDVVVDGLMRFKGACKICGETCTVTVPVVGKNVSFYPGDCPIAAGAVKKTMSVAVPTGPIPKSVSGTVTATDASGAVFGVVDFTSVASLAAAGNCSDPAHGCAGCPALAPNETCVSTATGFKAVASPEKCVVATSDQVLLGKALEYVCGAVGTPVQCAAINAGGCCFDPNTATNHAAWAMQQYYSQEWKSSGKYACDFNGAGKLAPWA